MILLLAVSCSRFGPTTYRTVTEAAAMGDRTDVRRHIARGSDLSSRGDSGATALHMAAFRGDTVMIGLLVRAGADPGVTDSLGRGTLSYSALGGQAAAAGYILRKLENRSPGSEGVSRITASAAFRIAVARNDPEFVDTLLSYGADPDEDLAIHGRPIEWAVLNDADRVLMLLADRGAEIHRPLPGGGTLLHLAAQATTRQEPHTRMLHTLCDLGLDPNTPDSSGRTPLHIAIMYGYPESAQILLEHSADPEIRDARGVTPLELARQRADQGEPRFLDQLRANGAPRS